MAAVAARMSGSSRSEGRDAALADRSTYIYGTVCAEHAWEEMLMMMVMVGDEDDDG